MNIYTKFLRYINALSIDIAIGAVACSKLLYIILDLNSIWHYDLVLGLSVWLIYTLDHLVDAKLIKKEAVSFRHRFHQKHFTFISLIALLAILINAAFTLFYFPMEIIIAGLSLMIFVVVHQILNHFSKDYFFLFGKEMRVALGYSLGIALSPFISAKYISPDAYLALVILFLLALINLLFFSTIEREADMEDRFTSISLYWSPYKISQSIKIAALFCLFLCLYFISLSEHTLIGLLLLTMLFILFLSFRKSQLLISTDLYRSLGDGIFLIPIVLFWL
ncbi:hypothetical protein HZR84_01150 [Hyphobacterium sp. CCMP332]|nr:hypothetical protein HZR84_01150 [Hyphobacterium sp. CCMP332]